MSPTNPTSLSESDRYDPVLFGPKKKRRRRKRKKIQLARYNIIFHDV
jgi:hypothetical protein